MGRYCEWADRAAITQRATELRGPYPGSLEARLLLPSADVMGGRLSQGAPSRGPRVNGLPDLKA